MEQRSAQLIDIVRRDVGRHADGNAGRAVGKKVGKRGGKDDGLLIGAVVSGPEVHRVFVNAVEQRLGGQRHAAFGVAHGRRVIAIDVAEIALAIDQRVSNGKILGQAHKRVINRLIAVRMEVAHHLANDLGALLVTAFRIKPQLAHRIEDAPVDRLEAVAHIRERAVHDGGERVGEIALLQGLAQRHWLDGPGARQNRFRRHDGGLAPRTARLKRPWEIKLHKQMIGG